MNRKLLLLPILVLSLFLVSSLAQADVVLEDIEANFAVSNAGSFTSGTIDTGSGGGFNNYVITACGVVDPNGDNSFSNPTPGAWTTLDTGQCGGDFSCIAGTWGRAIGESNSVETTCSWSSNAVFVYTAASMRFSQVDLNDPIIDIACDTGVNSNPSEATAPSINTEAGSYVVRSITYNPITPPSNETSRSIVNFDPNDTFGEGFAFNTFQVIDTRLQAMFFENAGPTGPFAIEYGPFSGPEPIRWRACTIALRMGMLERNVPTMSEWGLISFAAFAGIAGVWYLRRRQVAA